MDCLEIECLCPHLFVLSMMYCTGAFASVNCGCRSVNAGVLMQKCVCVRVREVSPLWS